MSESGRALTAAELQDAIIQLEDLSEGLTLYRCQKCGDPYNIPTHPETCDGTTIREMLRR